MQTSPPLVCLDLFTNLKVPSNTGYLLKRVNIGKQAMLISYEPLWLEMDLTQVMPYIEKSIKKQEITKNTNL